MKTKVEINEYVIEIEEVEGRISVKAEKDGEVIEEFSLQADESAELEADEEEIEGSEIKGFGDFEEEEDFDSDEEEIQDEEESQDDEEIQDEEESQDDEEIQDEEENVPGALESFQSFINKRKK